MKQHLALPDLAAELKRQLETKADYVADTRWMGFHPVVTDKDPVRDFSVTIDDVEGEFVVADYAHRQIADRASIPAKFYDRLREKHPDLLTRTVATLWNREPETRMIRTLDGRARAFLSDRYRRVDNFDVAEVVLGVLPEFPRYEVASAALTDTRMYLKIMLPELEREVLRSRLIGDVVRAGFVVSNSEVGAGALKIEPMAERLICKNGMISTAAFSRYHVGRRVEADDEEARRVFSEATLRLDDEALKSKIRDVVRAAANEAEFETIVAKMSDLAEIRVEGDPVAAVTRLADARDLSETERGSVLEHLIDGGDLSAWGYLNAVTRTAEDAESYDRATELERLGGDLLAVAAEEWAVLTAT